MMHMAAEHMDPDVPDIWFRRHGLKPLVAEDLKTNLCLAFPLPPMDDGASPLFGALLHNLRHVHPAHV